MLQIPRKYSFLEHVYRVALFLLYDWLGVACDLALTEGRGCFHSDVHVPVGSEDVIEFRDLVIMNVHVVHYIVHALQTLH